MGRDCGRDVEGQGRERSSGGTLVAMDENGDRAKLRPGAETGTGAEEGPGAETGSGAGAGPVAGAAAGLGAAVGLGAAAGLGANPAGSAEAGRSAEARPGAGAGVSPARIRRKRRDRKRRPPAGSSPGTIVAPAGSPRPVIDMLGYDSERLVERPGVEVGEVKALSTGLRVTWINVTGFGDASVVETLARDFGLHRLAVEDVMNTNQRPKVEEYGGQVFIVFRAPEPTADAGTSHPVVMTEQISLFLLPGVVITFQEGRADCFEPVRDRVRRSVGRIRGVAADYLAYALLDAAIDAYFPIAEDFGDRAEELESASSTGFSAATASGIHRLRRDLSDIRRSVWPLRDLTNTLVRDVCPLITDETRLHFRDCYDHTVQLIDILENARETASSLLELSLSMASYRMNEVMKVLTIFSTVFMPLTFVVGVYGMNFRETSRWNMPELNWPFGYVMVMGLCAAIAAGMLLYFRRKGWLGGASGGAK